MSRWLYQMSEGSYAFEDFKREVREGREIRWPTRRIMFASDAPAAGDIIICFYAVSACDSPGICGFGMVTKYLPKSRTFDWMPLPPTNKLKLRPWWNERVNEIADSVRRQSLRGTMYELPAALETDLRRGLFAWAGA